MCFAVLTFDTALVLSGVIAMAMLMIVTQLWNHTGACVWRKAIQKEIMWVSPLSIYATYEQPQQRDFSPGKDCVCVCWCRPIFQRETFCSRFVWIKETDVFHSPPSPKAIPPQPIRSVVFSDLISCWRLCHFQTLDANLRSDCEHLIKTVSAFCSK